MTSEQRRSKDMGFFLDLLARLKHCTEGSKAWSSVTSLPVKAEDCSGEAIAESSCSCAASGWSRALAALLLLTPPQPQWPPCPSELASSCGGKKSPWALTPHPPEKQRKGVDHHYLGVEDPLPGEDHLENLNVVCTRELSSQPLRHLFLFHGQGQCLLAVTLVSHGQNMVWS